MSDIALQVTDAIIEQAEKSGDQPRLSINLIASALMEREAYFVLLQLCQLIPNRFPQYLKGIRLIDPVMNDKPRFVQSEKFIERLKAWSLYIRTNRSDFGFGELKLNFEEWFYWITSEGAIEFEYQDGYLVSVAKAAEQMDLEKQTVYNYCNQGLELVEKKKKMIPKHAIECWKDPALNFLMQWNYLAKKRRTITIEQQMKEIEIAISAFEVQYGNKTFEDVFGEFTPQEADTLDNATDYFDWKDLIESHEKLSAESETRQ